MKKVIIWGMGNDYEKMLNHLNYEIDKKNIDIIGIVIRNEDRYCKRWDGHPVYVKEEIEGTVFDYLIITSNQYRDVIIQEATQLGIRRNQIIDGSVFSIPFFDFAKYVSLIENPITLLSDDCWGGMYTID